MAEHKNQNPKRDKQQGPSPRSQQSGSQQETSWRRDDEKDVQQTQGNRNNQSESLTDDDMTGSRWSSDRGTGRAPQSIADDRSREADRSRRDFSSDREAGELGSDVTERNREDDDDLDGSGGRRNR